MDTTICQVLNTVDKTTMTITTEWWDDETIKVTIFREGMVPLSGQTTVAQQLGEFARTEIPREKCVIDMRNELSGKENEAQFSLRETRLSWKKKAWRRGGLDVHPIKDVVTLADMSLKWLNEQARLQRSSDKKRQEDKTLQNNYDQLVAKLKTMEASKKSMEDKLYAKFLTVLNEKKKRLRDLEEKLKSHTTGTSDRSAAVYDEDTDKSDHNSEESSDALEPKLVVFTSSDHSKTRRLEPYYSSESEQDEMVLKFDETHRDNLDTDDDLFSQ